MLIELRARGKNMRLCCCYFVCVSLVWPTLAAPSGERAKREKENKFDSIWRPLGTVCSHRERDYDLRVSHANSLKANSLAMRAPRAANKESATGGSSQLCFFVLLRETVRCQTHTQTRVKAARRNRESLFAGRISAATFVRRPINWAFFSFSLFLSLCHLLIWCADKNKTWPSSIACCRQESTRCNWFFCSLINSFSLSFYLHTTFSLFLQNRLLFVLLLFLSSWLRPKWTTQTYPRSLTFLCLLSFDFRKSFNCC